MAGEENRSKGKRTQNDEIPKEEREKAYIMFLNLYWEWLNTEEKDQLIIMQEGVERLGLKKSEQYEKWNEIEKEDDIDRELSAYYLYDDSTEDDSPVSTSMFDEYVADVYLSFFDKFNGFCQSEKVEEQDIINAFTDFIHKSWKREEQQFNQVKEKFLERVFNEWDEMSSELTDKEFDKFVDEELQKRKNQYIKIRDQYDKKRTWFYSMEDLFFKLAKLARSRRVAEQKRGAKLASIEDESLNGQLNKTKENFEEQVISRDEIDHYLDTLNDTDKKIAYLRASGYKLEEIAEKVGMHTSTVSRRLKKIKVPD